MTRSYAYPLLTATVILTAQPLLAQEDGGGSMLENFLQDTLSGDDQNVTVRGLQGALSAKATIEEITVADDQGVWLTIRDAELDWNRLALLRGRFSVNALTAAEIDVARAPGATTKDEPAPSAETQPFSLPELPVSIEIGEIKVTELSLGEPLIGVAADLSVMGNLTLADGALDTNLDINRLDLAGDRVTLTASFQNTTREINLDLLVNEAEGGLIATALKIPDSPPISLSAKGAGPLTDFTADIALSSDKQQRVTGQVQLRASPSGAPDGIAFAADLGGDLTPFLADDLDPFFGPKSQLVVNGQTKPEGALSISDLELTTQALDLKGELQLGTGGTLDLAALQGRITPPDGQAVILPVAGGETSIAAAQISGLFDQKNGNLWDLSLTANDFKSPQAALDSARISAQGVLDQTDGLTLTGDIQASLQGIAMSDPALTTALGQRITLDGQFTAGSDETLNLSGFELRGSDYQMGFDALIAGLSDGLTVDGSASVEASDLARFSDLAGMELGGTARVQVEGSGSPLSRSFDGKVMVDGKNLSTGRDDIDPVIQGETTITLDGERGSDGITIRDFQLNSQAAQAKASGTVTTPDGDLMVDGQAKLNAPDLSVFSGLAQHPLTGSLSAQLEGSVAPSELQFDLKGSLLAKDIQTGIELADKLIAGQTSLTVDAARTSDELTVNTFRLRGSALTADASGTVAPEAGGLTYADKLDDIARIARTLSGPLTLEGNVSPTASGVEGTANLRGPDSSYAALKGSVDTDGDADIAFDAKLNRIERFAPDFPGTITAKGTAQRAKGQWTIDATAEGPAEISSKVGGTFDESSGNADLTAKGGINIGIANLFISPNKLDGTASYDLALKGAPALESLSGSITTSGTSMALPGVGQTITGIGGSVNLSQGRATIALTGGPRAGGRFSVDGPVDLAPPFNANITTTLDNLILTDTRLYETTLNGQISMTGALAGDSAIAGQITFEETNINLAAATGAVGAAPIPVIQHVNESAAGLLTRERAGLVVKEETSKSDSRILLNISLLAPRAVFVRGRGVNAELGGRLFIGGTTSTVIPSGQIKLIRGTFDILGRRLALTKGIVTLQGDLTPYIEFESTNSTSDGTASIEIAGPLDAPEVNVFSDPERPPEEALAMLLFGNRFSELSPIVIAQMAASLAQLSGAGGDATKGIRDATGLDSVDISSTEGGAGRLGAGAYLSDNLYTDINVNTEGDTELNLNLDVTDNLTVRGTVDGRGETGVGVFFGRDY